MPSPTLAPLTNATPALPTLLISKAIVLYTSRIQSFFSWNSKSIVLVQFLENFQVPGKM